jgi:hypothetical protein
MAQEIETVRKVENRTPSELVQDALRSYFDTVRYPQGKATPAELRAIERGRRAFARGEYVTLAQLEHDLDSRARQASRKRIKKAAAK